ncbi:acetyl-CoA hydrolase/transferase C-terminal domain-containing protein [Sphingobium sp. H39-3-25]|uniref:acetyl-CoA hydrolase/transferase C-terminal domain-containing protein n=1 Tax=Sphingobium arseniciresistens TaxID=3030834 RepID=UPI0023B97594|nr:acetyl-CoA hydrolase/transferase C-terminal domain-containing protein [Sphingobium arseniciresistens]
MLSFSSRLSGQLSATRSLYVSACAAEIDGLPDMFETGGLRDAVITGIFSPLVNQRSYADPDLNVKVRTFLLTRPLKADMGRGLIEYCPWRYAMVNRWLVAPDRFDTAIVMLSPPDEAGMCSLGVQADFFPSFHRSVRRIIGFINPQLPPTHGHDRVPYASLAAAIDYDVPLPEMAARPSDAATVAIATFIGNLVPDGATVQVGTGQLPSEVLVQLSHHRNLKVHTGIIDDNILKLEEAGALSRAGPIVTGTAIGTRRLYDGLADKGRFAFKPVAYTHAHGNIAGVDRFTAINSVLQVDLLGQVSGEAIGGRIAASPGGLPDFARGAQGSPGGQSIIAVRASGGARQNGIVPLIDNPAIITNGAVDAHRIVTEFGVADVRDLSMDARAQAIIAIAAPEARDSLELEWRKIRQGFF